VGALGPELWTFQTFSTFLKLFPVFFHLWTHIALLCWCPIVPGPLSFDRSCCVDSNLPWLVTMASYHGSVGVATQKFGVHAVFASVFWCSRCVVSWLHRVFVHLCFLCRDSATTAIVQSTSAQSVDFREAWLSDACQCSVDFGKSVDLKPCIVTRFQYAVWLPFPSD